MREADEEIREIKKEIIESRGLIIKTNNLVNALGADIKSIAKRQTGYERRFTLNSWVAYVIFSVLCFVGLKLASDAQVREIEHETRTLRGEVRQLRTDLGDETRKAQLRGRAETRASEYYDLVQQQRRQEAVERYSQISQENLSPAEREFFRDVHDQFRLDLSLEAYQAGLSLMRTGRYAEAAERFHQSMSLRDDASHMPAVKYNLAVALRELGRQSEALVYARQVVEQNIDRELQDDATWLVAECATDLEDLDTAIEAIRSLLRRWPRSSYAPDARSELHDLIRRARQAPSSPG